MHQPGTRAALRLVAVAILVLAAVLPTAAPAAAATSWSGSVDLYRNGTFTTQKTWLWCTAADVQIIRNIVRHQADHSRASQQRYFDYMRAHNRYRIPVKDGVDPAGWAAGLRHYVDVRYRLVASTSFDSALRSAVTNLRRTNLPVGITVSHGNHAWILTGFSATADPATTTHFAVTSVRVVGPLWGLQSRSYGYDMRPNTRLTLAQLRGFFTPWRYDSVHMAWENRWVSIQPVATTSNAAAPPKATSQPSPAQPSPAAAGVTAPASPAALDRIVGSPAPISVPSVVQMAVANPRAATVPPSDSPAWTNVIGSAQPVRGVGLSLVSMFLLVVALAAGIFGLGVRNVRRGRPRSR
jgi:hypothetical protein